MDPDIPPPPPPRNPRGSGRVGPSSLPRWSIWVLLGVAAAALLLPNIVSSDNSTAIPYTDVLSKAQAGDVKSMEWNNTDGSITGELTDGTKFHSNGPLTPSDADRQVFADHNVEVKFSTPQSSIWPTLLIYALPIVVLVGLFVWMQRRAQSQMGGIRSSGRSRARTYSTERPGTTFSDVAGYEGVKQEIKEV